MKTEGNILIAFILNLFFSVFEFFGGIITGSVAIISDSLHDMGDALSIGIAFYLEKISKKQPNNKYTYGYLRYSVLGGLITTLILMCGSVLVTINAIDKIISPKAINYNGMIIFAIIGVIVNFIAALFTKEGESLNQKAVNLHMLEDVASWVVVLIGAVVMSFTNFNILDPILSIIVAVFIFINAVKNLKEALRLFLEKAPSDVNINQLKEHLIKIDGVMDLHHIHVWSLDGINNYATMHIVANDNYLLIKNKVKQELKEHGIAHSTIEFEKEDEDCQEKTCIINHRKLSHHHHHHQ